MGHALAGRYKLASPVAETEDLRDGGFEARVEEGKKQFAGFELPGRTLGVIGLGAVGGLVADTAIKLGMKVIGFTDVIQVGVLIIGGLATSYLALTVVAEKFGLGSSALAARTGLVRMFRKYGSTLSP